MLLISCQEEETLKRPFMTISNAIPVQFWVNGVETYNEKQICGVEPVCFCQPFNCTDEIRIQFQDTTGIAYSLQILDSNTNELNSISIPEVSSGVYQIELIPANYGICDEIIQLKIITEGLSVTFDSSLLPAVNAGGAIPTWTWGSGKANVTLPNNFAPTKRLQIPYEFISGSEYTVTFDLDIVDGGNGAGATTRIIAYFTDGVTSTNNYTISNLNLGSHALSFSLTATSNWPYLEIIGLADASSSFARVLSLDNILIPTVEHSQSDCLDIKTSHDCTLLLEYTNSEDFNNIVYETSPTSEYKLRIPAQFWKEDNPMEQEDSELSNGVIKTRRQSIQQKKYLEIGYMPNYMHLKTQLALMHDTVTIDGSQWKKRDAYESESIKRYPLKRANVWLTLYNSIDDNIL